MTFTRPLEKSLIAKAPFNPFLISDMQRGHEVHLAGKKTTDKANKALFNTDDDYSKGALNFTNGGFLIR